MIKARSLDQEESVKPVSEIIIFLCESHLTIFFKFQDSHPEIVQTTQTVVTVTNTVKVNDKCKPGNNDCDAKAKCSPRGADDFECACVTGFVDRSPNPVTRPGRICIPCTFDQKFFLANSKNLVSKFNCSLCRM